MRQLSGLGSSLAFVLLEANLPSLGRTLRTWGSSVIAAVNCPFSKEIPMLSLGCFGPLFKGFRAFPIDISVN